MPVFKKKYIVSWEEKNSFKRGEWVMCDNLDAATELFDDMCAIGNIKVYMSHIIKSDDVKWVSPHDPGDENG